MTESVRIVPLGGMGNVTKNMFLYEYGNQILIIDCGIGFPEINMHGVDLLIPDITYLREQVDKGKEIVGMILSHGHDDHIAATGYILPNLPDFPIYASPLTAEFAKQRMSDHVVNREITQLQDRQPIQLGNFSIEAITVTHSVPDTKHLIIRTPAGILYHGSDFKLDPNPVDGRTSDIERIMEVGREGILCMLIDCLRIENKGATKSESTVRATFEQEMSNVKGKIVMTLMSSHIHRIQQAVDVAINQGRKVVFIGRSVEQNVENALMLGKLKLDRHHIVNKRDIDQYGDDKLCLIVAGSQGQEGSTLVRAVFGEHQILRITQQDKVIFSADVIPGNEQTFYGAIDELAKNEIDVIYPDIVPGLHVSGHAGADEQRQMLEYGKAKYLFPIGGAYRHRKLFRDMAMTAGYDQGHILLPGDGDALQFQDGHYSKGETIHLKELMVDGKGVGDVGTLVLSDRKVMSQDGMIVLVVPRINNQLDLGKIEVISRGFIFMRDSEEFIFKIKQMTAEIITELQQAGEKEEEIRKKIDRRLTRRIDKMIGRTPLILPVFLNLDEKAMQTRNKKKRKN